jgi:hypothetical protein
MASIDHRFVTTAFDLPVSALEQVAGDGDPRPGCRPRRPRHQRRSPPLAARVHDE